MARYACSNDGVEELKKTAESVREAAEEIRNETNTMRSVADQYGDTLGPHKSELSSALDGIAGAMARCIEPTNAVAEKLMSVAKKYEGIISRNPFGSAGN